MPIGNYLNKIGGQNNVNELDSIFDAIGVEQFGTRIRIKQACKVLSEKFSEKDFESRINKVRATRKSMLINNSVKENLIKILQEESAGNFLLKHSDLEFTKELGSGTSGRVYKGILRGNKVAIKVVKLLDKSSIEEFSKEFQVMSVLKSDYIVHFFGACLEPKVCMVMEYCNRKTLNHVMQDSRFNFNWTRALHFAISTLKGLDYLHTRHPPVLHRDMKSLNLLVNETEGVFSLKVSDFGLARFGNTLNQQSLARLCGTYAYLAPEVCQNVTFTEKGDMFSVGIILWEIVYRVLMGRYTIPYSEYSDITMDFQIAVAVSEKALRPTIPALCPYNLRELILTLYQATPTDRPSTSQALHTLQQIETEYQEHKESWDKSIQQYSV